MTWSDRSSPRIDGGRRRRREKRFGHALCSGSGVRQVCPIAWTLFPRRPFADDMVERGTNAFLQLHRARPEEQEARDLLAGTGAQSLQHLLGIGGPPRYPATVEAEGGSGMEHVHADRAAGKLLLP